jgi:metallo-beta-lactamase class B
VLLGVALLVSVAAPGPRPLVADPPKVCDSCAEWNAPREPYRVFGNTWYVGTGGLSAILITSDAGHVLIDGGLPQSAPPIDTAIRKLGFRAEDIRLILNSHEHYDHAGGIAALQRASGATVAAGGAAALENGGPTPDDPQYAIGVAANRFPAVKDVRAVRDGETLGVGALAVTARRTPGHTPGGTSWTWRSCEETRCLDVVYADSLTAVSADEFRFSAFPEYVAAFRRSIEAIGSLPCDVLLTPHPSASGMDDRLRRRNEDPAGSAFVDPKACRAYADRAALALDRRLAQEKSAPVEPAR